MKSPKSLTAVVHVKFHYEDGEGKGGIKSVSDRDIEVISRVLDRAAGLEPELQEVLVKFADYLSQNCTDRHCP
ncbi:hypothetical protein KKH23_09325 [Patescibacteria group bacterium]|nr:hypothetical protein [Patescibacteria group bacterium]